MPARLLITSAGRGASNNLVRSLRAGDRSHVVVGCHDDQFVLKNSAADRNYLVPPPGHCGWLDALRHVVAVERIDLVIPVTDTDVVALSRARAALGRRVFLPRAAVVDVCQDKYRLLARLRAHGVPAPATHPVTELTGLGGLFRRLRRQPLVWCRARTGTGALAAIPVRTAGHARNWIEYWRDVRGVPVSAFVLSEYLPGRDFGCQSLWKDGRLVLVKTYERLSYLGTGNQPAEVSSVSALARTVVEPDVVECCVRAIRLLHRAASGVFSVDLKGDADGSPCITEINAGRFSSATNLLDLVGTHNMAATYVNLALGEPVALRDEYDVTEPRYMLRDVDCLPRIFDAQEFFHAVADARDPARRLRDRARRRATHNPTGRTREVPRWGTLQSTRRSGTAGPSSGSRRRPRARRRARSSGSSGRR